LDRSNNQARLLGSSAVEKRRGADATARRLLFAIACLSILAALAACSPNLTSPSVRAVTQSSLPISQPSSGPTTRPCVEQRVLAAVAAGQTADLSQEPAEGRELSARFLRDLFGGKLKDVTVGPGGIQIKGCVVCDELDLRDELISREVSLKECRFEGGLQFAGATFVQDLSITDSPYIKGIDFTGVVAKGDIDLTGSIKVNGPAKFDSLHVSSMDASCSRFNDTVSFDAAQVDSHLDLLDCTFVGTVDFVTAKIGGQFDASGAKFLSKKYAANGAGGPAAGPCTRPSTTAPTSQAAEEFDDDFYSMTVGGQCFLNNSVQFQGSVRFRLAQVGSDMEMDDGRASDPPDNQGTQIAPVSGSPSAAGTLFSGPADFSSIHITGSLYGSGAEFKERAEFNDARVDGNLIFDRCTFWGPVMLVAAKVGGQLRASNAHFRSTRNSDLAAETSAESSATADPSSETKPPPDAPTTVNRPPPVTRPTAVTQPIGNAPARPATRPSAESFDNDFYAMHVGGQCFLDGAEVLGTTSFQLIRTASDLILQDAHFQRDVDLTEGFVGGKVILDDATFDRLAAFGLLHIVGHLKANHATFQGRAEWSGVHVEGNADFDTSMFIGPAVFNTSQVDGTLWLNRCIFGRTTDFTSAKISGQFHLDDARFLWNSRLAPPPPTGPTSGPSEDKTVPAGPKASGGFDNDFYSMSVGGQCFLDGANFAGQTEFRLMHVGSDLSMLGVYFGEAVLLTDVSIAGTVVLSALGEESEGRLPRFDGLADFSGIHVTADFKASDTTFGGQADFENARIGGASATFQDVIFQGDANFTRFHVSGQMVVLGSRFLGDAGFGGMVVDGDLLLSPSLNNPVGFTGSFDFSEARIGGDVVTYGVTFGSTANWRAASVTGDLKLNGATFSSSAQGVVFDAMTVGHRAVFYKTSFATKPQIALSSYYEIRTRDTDVKLEEDEMEELSGFVKSSVYNPVAFLELEEYFKRTGHTDWGDEVYIDQQWREHIYRPWKEPGFGALKSHSWWANLVLYEVVRFGRRPAWAFLWSLVIVLAGACVFKREKMSSRIKDGGADSGLFRGPEWKKRMSFYKPFWYSLDLFLPVIGLNSEDAWTPQKGHPGLLFYMRVHKLLGWILIPLGLAAITGLVH